MFDKKRLSVDEVLICYEEDVVKLLKYLPWLEKVSGSATSSIYSGEGIAKTSMAVPVFDSTLLSFVKTAETTEFINRNYVYTYSRYGMKNAKDELNVIEDCTLMDMTVLGDILSKYVVLGRTKGLVWSEGVQNGVYLALVLKLKELMEIRKKLI